MFDQIIIFGESIWDLFEDGRRCLGGSGLNVAWHLQGLQQKSEFISRIGEDANGREMLQKINAWGINSKNIQIDPEQPTAYLDVIIDEQGGHHFPSPPEHALDYIEFDENWLSLPKSSLIYHGTYMLRHQVTRNTILRMKREGYPVFLDMNLREQYWNHVLLDEWVRDLAFVKLSNQEFDMWMPGLHTSVEGQVDTLQSMMAKRNIGCILLTLGAEGSVIIAPETTRVQKPTQHIQIKNTVGAGDAFCAGFIYGLLHHQNVQRCGEIATKLAEKICTVESATSLEKDFYTSFSRKYLSAAK